MPIDRPHMASDRRRIVRAVRGIRGEVEFEAGVEPRFDYGRRSHRLRRPTRARRLVHTRLPQVSGGTGIGVMARTKDVRVVLPFRVSFRSRPDVGGPSAGLACALALTDMLDSTDDARTRSVAATGTIDADGSVGSVGGLHEKAIAARDDGADVFVVPAEELSSVDGDGLQARGVRDLAQAVHLLQAA